MTPHWVGVSICLRVGRLCREICERLRTGRLSSYWGNFNYPNICWKSNTASCSQSSRFLERIEDNFLSQVISNPTLGDAILDLVVTNATELIGDLKTGGSLGCSDRALVEQTLLREMGITKSIA